MIDNAYKKAHDILEDLQREMTKNRFEYSESFIYANGIAIIALEKQEKYRWHDLRKDPNDLPDYGKEVLVLSVISEFYVLWYGRDIKHWKDENGRSAIVPIAWREIEPFEEGEK